MNANSKKKGPPLAPQEVLQQLRVVLRTMQAHSRWVEKQCGVSGAQLWALWELHAAPGIRVSDLSAIMAIQQSTASNLLDKLEAKHFIRRERSGEDQRVVRLYLTAAGEQLVRQAPQPAQGAIIHALQQLAPAELAKLHDSLDRLLDRMDGVERTSGLPPISEGES